MEAIERDTKELLEEFHDAEEQLVVRNGSETKASELTLRIAPIDMLFKYRFLIHIHKANFNYKLDIELALVQINYTNQREPPTAEGSGHCLPLELPCLLGSWCLHCGGLMFQSQSDWPAWELIRAVVPHYNNRMVTTLVRD